MGISAFAFFNCVGSNRGAPATSSRAERAIPLSPLVSVCYGLGDNLNAQS